MDSEKPDNWKRGALHPSTGKIMTAVQYNFLARRHGWKEMPTWEAALRDKLENELPEKMYSHTTYGMATDKGGEIEFRVALERSLREQEAPMSFTQKLESSRGLTKPLTYSTVKRLLLELFYPTKK